MTAWVDQMSMQNAQIFRYVAVHQHAGMSLTIAASAGITLSIDHGAALTLGYGQNRIKALLKLRLSDSTRPSAVEATMAEAPGRIRRLSADKGYDADWLRDDLRDKGITPVIPGSLLVLIESGP